MTTILAYKRSLLLLLLITLAVTFAVSDMRLATWHALLPVFEWMETTPMGVVGKTWGAVFALVQTGHLLAMALLGGAVLAGDGRLLGLIFADQSLRQVQAQCQKIWLWGLVLVVLSGVFMACGVALKVYYLEVFWYKMLALAVGVLFQFFVRRPLVNHYGEVSPAALRLVAVASLMIWFSVAATGRWIGFSG